MKNVFIVILLLAVAGLGFYALRSMRISFSGERGEIQTIRRGDLTIPINATGEVRYKPPVEIKSEASGTVDKIYFKAGDFVRKGELVVRLDPKDENRSVERAKADLIRATANLEKAKITLRERRETGVMRAQAGLDGILAQLKDAEYKKQKVDQLYEEGKSNADERVQITSNYERLMASKAGSKVEVEQAKLAITSAEQDVTLALAAETTARNNLGDAEERLRETEIFAPLDGLILDVKVQEGEVIQSGSGSFTGGTILATMADTSSIYVRTEVDEADFGEVSELAPPVARPGGNVSGNGGAAGGAPVEAAGTPVEIDVEAYRTQKFSGVIERIYPEPKKSASVVTYYVDILLVSENRSKLALGMQAEVTFTAQSVRNALLVRHDAIKKEEGRLGVYVPRRVEGQPEPEPRFVLCRFGLDNGSYAEVLEGEIKEGDEVYVKLPRSNDEEKK